MMRQRRTWIPQIGSALLLLGSLSLAGCVNVTTNEGKGQTNVTPGKTAPPAGGKTVRAALVLDTGGVDDKSFNASAWAGMQRAQKELGMAENDIKYTESKAEADYK